MTLLLVLELRKALTTMLMSSISDAVASDLKIAVDFAGQVLARITASVGAAVRRPHRTCALARRLNCTSTGRAAELTLTSRKKNLK